MISMACDISIDDIIKYQKEFKKIPEAKIYWEPIREQIQKILDAKHWDIRKMQVKNNVWEEAIVKFSSLNGYIWWICEKINEYWDT